MIAFLEALGLQPVTRAESATFAVLAARTPPARPSPPPPRPIRTLHAHPHPQ